MTPVFSLCLQSAPVTHSGGTECSISRRETTGAGRGIPAHYIVGRGHNRTQTPADPPPLVPGPFMAGEVHVGASDRVLYCIIHVIIQYQNMLATSLKVYLG